MFRGSAETNPVKIRIRNPDGSVNIHCRRCGHFICKRFATGYGTFTNALCYWCQNNLPRPQEAIDPQEQLLMEIYATNDEDGTIEKLARPKKKFNILDMVINTVQALGFGKPKEQEIKEEEIQYNTADNESSKAIAKRKKREPIFDKNKKKEK